MAEHGAKHFILVNRSGLSGASGKSTVDELQAKGAEVTIEACDISDEGKVSKMLLDMQQKQPPIRGAIHGAMVLRVCTLFQAVAFISLTKPRTSTSSE